MMYDNGLTLYFNGEEIQLEQPQLIHSLVTEQALSGRFIVVVNDTVVPRSQWQTRWLKDGDKVEIMTPVSGG